MTDTPLDIDKQIWTVFSVGVISSVVILYHFYIGELKNCVGILALALGFAILVYSFFLTLGYGFKKKRLIDVTKDVTTEKMKGDLEKRWYFRTRWMGELIFIFLIVIYGIFLGSNSKWWIPLLIFLIFVILFSITNCSAKKKYKKKYPRRNWIGCCKYFSS